MKKILSFITLTIIIVISGCSKKEYARHNIDNLYPSSEQIDKHTVYQNTDQTFNRREDTVYIFDEVQKITGFQIASDNNHFTIMIDSPSHQQLNSESPLDSSLFSVYQNNHELVGNGVYVSQSNLNGIEYGTQTLPYKLIDNSTPVKLKITDSKTHRLFFETTYYLN